jgi:hypothetical protein
MGFIDKHDINSIITEFNIENYIETGTGAGICLSHMIPFNLKQYHTIEIHSTLYDLAKEKFKDYSNCNLHFGESSEKLVDALKDTNGPTLFFLDAHFPGADFGYAQHDSEKDYNIRLPLENELKIISDNKDTSKDVLILDDLRIYEDGPFEDGNWVDRKRIGGEGIEFIYNLFEKSHDISKDYRDQGYILLFPKK